MHQSSFHLMKQFKRLFEANFTGRVNVLDVGSYGVNGTYKEIFSDEERYIYTGLDLTPGQNVDYVPSDPYRWKEIEDESFDLVISGQVFEHIEFPWLTILEMRRVLKKNGLICIIAPSRGPEHRYPVDCWRYYPDGFNALAKWAGLEVVESRTIWGASGFKDGSDQWGDTMGILRKGFDNSSGHPTSYNLYLDGRYKRNINKENPLQIERPDYYFSIDRRDIVDMILRHHLSSERVLEIGCAGGATGKLLKERAKVKEYIGVEISEEAALLARQYLSRVMVADIEKADLERDFGIEKGSFDLILCLDVLEHLYNPWEVVANLRGYLNKNGCIIASIPNIQNISIINNLVIGRWQYEKAGLLDVTHLRFFAIEGIRKMFEGAGLVIDGVERILNPSPDVSKIRESGNNIDLGKMILKDLSRDEVMNLFTYQYIVTARAGEIEKKDAGEILKENVTIQKDLTSIIILTFNQIEYTKGCIESIKRYTPKPYEIIFVDNGSKDGTVEWLRRIVRETPDYRLIENKENQGFAGGNNQGMAEARGEYIVLMNNDVVVTPGWLDRMIAVAERNPKIGMVGPMSNYVSGPQRVSQVGYDTTTLTGLNQFAQDYSQRRMGRVNPFWRVVGFCMLIKRSVVEKIGGLDERYGLGNFEDDDFSLRARLAGFEPWIAGDCFVHHFGSRTFSGSGIDYQESLKRNWEIFKKKWGIPSEIEYGAPFDLSEILSQRFDPVRHYCPLTPEEYSLSRGEELFQSGDVEGAKLIFNRLLQENPEEVDLLNNLGVIAYQGGEIDQAVTYFNRVLTLSPDHLETLENLGHCLIAKGAYREAIQCFEKALELKPGDLSLLNSLGNCLIQAGDFLRAEDVYHRSYQIDETQMKVREILVGLERLRLMERERGAAL